MDILVLNHRRGRNKARHPGCGQLTIFESNPIYATPHTPSPSWPPPAPSTRKDPKMIPEKSQLSNPRRLLKSTRPHDNEESRNPLCSKSPYKHRARAIPNRERQILQPLPVHWKQASRGSTNDPRSRANRATKDRSWPKSRRRRPNSASKTPDFGGTPGSSEGSEGGRSSPHLLL